MVWNGGVDARRGELIIMLVGWRQGSMYEWTQHWRVARMLEIPEDDLVAVRDWNASDRFDRADRAVLAATAETLGSGAISARTWSEPHATDRKRVESGRRVFVRVVLGGRRLIKTKHIEHH